MATSWVKYRDPHFLPHIRRHHSKEKHHWLLEQTRTSPVACLHPWMAHNYPLRILAIMYPPGTYLPSACNKRLAYTFRQENNEPFSTSFPVPSFNQTFQPVPFGPHLPSLESSVKPRDKDFFILTMDKQKPGGVNRCAMSTIHKARVCKAMFCPQNLTTLLMYHFTYHTEILRITFLSRASLEPDCS